MVELETTTDEPMMRAFRCFPSGSAEPLDWSAASQAVAERRTDHSEGWTWLHLDRADLGACAWLYQGAGLSTEAAEALTSEDTRPRALTIDDGAILILRARNRLARDARVPMVSIRLFITRNAIVSIRLRPSLPTYRLADDVAKGKAPPSPGAFVGRLVEYAMAEIEAALDELDAQLEDLEQMAFSAPAGKLRTRRNDLNRLRRAAMAMKRFMRPQAEALKHVAGLGPELTPPEEAPGLREAADQAARIGDDLDALRDSAALVNEEMQARIADRLNKTMLRLAAVSTVFLPLTFATGLLGVNLAGIPYSDQAFAFSGFVALLAAVGAAAIYAVRRLDDP